MDVVATIDDPMTYKKPWTFTQPLTLMADTAGEPASRLIAAFSSPAPLWQREQ
jgi:hypothetical protein